MKVIEYSPLAQSVTQLPQEILRLIAIHLRHHRSPLAAQRDLWSCCLVSKDWYDSSVQSLYDSPVLTSRNFDAFAHVIASSRHRERRNGLENLVRHINMGGLAYESTRSTTSRLLSRTKAFLKSFTAPAVSFSAASLAPLSRCTELQYLDLSRDHYDFGLDQLMRSVRPLKALRYLNLSRECLAQRSTETLTAMHTSGPEFWPPNLTHLQVNESNLPSNPQEWTTLLSALPSHLTNLALCHNATYDAFDAMIRIDNTITAPQITSIAISVYRSDDTYSLSHLLRPFPNVVKVTVPAMTSWLVKDLLFISNDDPDSWTLITKGQSQSQHLIQAPHNMQWLVLEESADFVAPCSITMAELRAFVESCPRLMRVDVPESYLGVEMEEDELEMDRLNEVLAKRAKDMERKREDGTGRETEVRVGVDEAGIYATEAPRNQGVGMKRSFRYRGDD